MLAWHWLRCLSGLPVSVWSFSCVSRSSGFGEVIITNLVAKGIRFVGVTCLFLVTGFSYSQDNPKLVYWSATSLPNQPVVKHYTDFQLGFETQEMLFEFLPSYKAVHRPQNNIRIFKELTKEPNVCTGTKADTPRRRAAGNKTDIPQIVIPGLKLITRKGEEFDRPAQGDKPMDLMTYMALYPDALLGAVNGRHYGEYIDKQIAQLARMGRVYQRSAQHGIIGALDMLAEKRVSVILDYPTLTEHYSKQRLAGDEPLELSYYKVKDVPQFANGYVFCSKSEFGQELIDKLNVVIRQAAKQPRYYQAHIEDIPEEEIPSFTRYYNEVYGTSF